MSAPDIFPAILLALAVLAMVWAAWSLVCNEITYRQRLRIINLMAAEDLYRDYCMVSYDQHCRALELLRNPFALYGARVQAAISKDLNTGEAP